MPTQSTYAMERLVIEQATKDQLLNRQVMPTQSTYAMERLVIEQASYANLVNLCHGKRLVIEQASYANLVNLCQLDRDQLLNRQVMPTQSTYAVG